MTTRSGMKFKDKLTAYATTKSAIRFPSDKPIPEKLVTEIVIFAAKENLARKLLKKTAG